MLWENLVIKKNKEKNSLLFSLKKHLKKRKEGKGKKKEKVIQVVLNGTYILKIV